MHAVGDRTARQVQDRLPVRLHFFHFLFVCLCLTLPSFYILASVLFWMGSACVYRIFLLWVGGLADPEAMYN